MDSQRTGPRLVEVETEDGLAAALIRVGLAGHRPALVVVGGASGLSGEAEHLVRRVVEQVVVPVALTHRAAIVDGGTDSGVMRIVGRAHGGRSERPSLVGVAVRRLVRVSGPTAADLAHDAAAAEPHHTHLVLVPGEQWGDESPWLSAVAGRLAAGHASVTLVLNGGAVTLSDAAHSVAAGRPVVAVVGTGRSADVLAAALGGDTAPTDAHARSARDTAASGLVTILDPSRPVGVQREQLSRLLRPR